MNNLEKFEIPAAKQHLYRDSAGPATYGGESHLAMISTALPARAFLLRCRAVAGVLGLSLLTLAACAPGPDGDTGSAIRFTESVPLPVAPELDCYLIETPAATYYLEKVGAGLASMIDRDGVDWISFSPEPGSRSAGEFRGFPNAVHREAGSYFHPLNQGTDPSTTRVEYAGPDRVTISAASGNGLWECRYDFYPTHCTFTMTKMPAGHKYWVLYEGTPGGKLDETNWWITSAIRERQSITENHEGDIPGPEWIAFGDRNVNRTIFMLNHEDDEHTDRFYQMNMEMTVFGFGRHRGEKFFDSAPRSFSIGFLETTDWEEISEAVARILTVDNE